MDRTLMEKVYGIAETKPFEVLPSGHKAWLLAQVGNLSATIMESQRETQLTSHLHREEEFLYILDGRLTLEDGRVANAGEAVYTLPNVPHPGTYAGRLLSIRVYPEPGVSTPKAELMKQVMRLEDADSFYEEKVMTLRRLWLATDSFSIVMNESEPGSAFKGTVHPEKEIVYVIQGQLEYDNGRVVTDGQAIVNLPDIPHPGRRGGKRHICSFEAKAPADPQLLARFKEKRG